MTATDDTTDRLAAAAQAWRDAQNFIAYLQGADDTWEWK